MRTTIIILFTFICASVYGQGERGEIRSGNRAYKKGHFQKSEIDYRRALEENPASLQAKYNLANALYKLKKGEEAVNTISPGVDSIVSLPVKASAYHNIGNYYLSQKKYQESVDAYKNSLRLNPGDMETKSNLAYAQKMLKDQQDKQNQQNQDQNKDKNKDQNKDKDQNQDQNKDQNQDKKDNQQPQPQPQITPQTAQQMLQAIQNKEKETQEKVKEEKAKVLERQKKEKNW